MVVACIQSIAVRSTLLRIIRKIWISDTAVSGGHSERAHDSMGLMYYFYINVIFYFRVV